MKTHKRRRGRRDKQERGRIGGFKGKLNFVEVSGSSDPDAVAEVS